VREHIHAKLPQRSGLTQLTTYASKHTQKIITSYEMPIRNAKNYIHYICVGKGIYDALRVVGGWLQPKLEALFYHFC